MTQAKYCTPAEGHLLAANKGKQVRVGNKHGIIEYNCWVEQADGEKHQVSLDLGATCFGVADAEPECEEVIARIFPELFH
jgi:hypothetical protein